MTSFCHTEWLQQYQQYIFKERFWYKSAHIIVKDVPVNGGTFPPGGGVVAVGHCVELANVPPTHDHLVCGRRR